MKIFVGFGFQERDEWIKDLVFPIIKAFGDEIVTGEELQGDQITDAVRQKILQSNALMGFLTKREPLGDGKGRTHRWVTDEISVAITHKLPVLEVREIGVEDQGGIAGDRQWVTYDEKARDKCLVEIVKTIGKWHRAGSLKLKLLPEEYVQELFPLHRKQDLRCTYSLLVEGQTTPEIATKLLPITGGLFIMVKEVPREALIQVHVEYQGRHWISSFESTDSLAIQLLKE